MVLLLLLLLFSNQGYLTMYEIFMYERLLDFVHGLVQKNIWMATLKCISSQKTANNNSSKNSAFLKHIRAQQHYMCPLALPFLDMVQAMYLWWDLEGLLCYECFQIICLIFKWTSTHDGLMYSLAYL